MITQSAGGRKSTMSDQVSDQGDASNQSSEVSEYGSDEEEAEKMNNSLCLKV